ncbi:MAG: C39 family peptidase [Legionella sp.]|nr:C39 family peptidase [Legionella sp.]
MINLQINAQPDDETCGPTSLHAIYHYYGLDINLSKVVKNVERSLSGGTLGPMLGNHALQQDFNVVIYTNNLDIFDPTWFDTQGNASQSFLKIKLKAQNKYKRSKHITQSSKAYLNFLALGGEVRFRTLTLQLLKSYFLKNIPIITGLSATYLYRSSRERYIGGEAIYDDIRGTPCGHFVVLCGYDPKLKRVIVADPHRANPISHDHYYKVSSTRLINAIMMGVLTYDANLIIIQPKGQPWKQ